MGLIVESFVLAIALLGNLAIGQYSPPTAKVEPLYPKGIRIWVPNEDGISLVAFHVKFNEDFEGLEAGTIARDIIRTKNGRWTYQDTTTRLRPGDIVYYWVHVVYDGLGYNLLDQQHQVTEFYNIDGTKVNTGSNEGTENRPCAPTETKIVDLATGRRKDVCAKQLLLNDQFDGLNETLWKHVEKFTGSPDYSFVVYRNDRRNVKCANGNLQFTPTLMQSEFGQDFIRHGNFTLQRCTGEYGTTDCQREARGPYILPPVLSGRLDTKSTFALLYGKVEIRAKLPRGDWIYPILRLEPLEKAPTHGSSSHPQLRVASSFGNSILYGPGRTDFSGHVLCGGSIEMKSGKDRSAGLPKRYSTSLWSDDFHVYELEWRRDGIRSRVDGIEYGSTATLKPFDKPFYLTLGLAVGGHDEFPDSSTSDGYAKPWRNVGSKALFDFYNATDLWSKTWSDDATDLKIDYIKVWAL